MMPPAYHCDHCGACCTNNTLEVFRIDLIREPCLQAHVEWIPGPAMQMRATVETGRCAFLKPDLDCEIYPTRPTACVAFEPGSPLCQESRMVLGIPPLLPI